jgi:hypothetical protein
MRKLAYLAGQLVLENEEAGLSNQWAGGSE